MEDTATSSSPACLHPPHPFSALQSDVLDEEKRLVSALDLFFVEEDGSRFKVSLPYQPYIYVQAKTDTDKEVVAFLSKKLAGRLAGIDMMDKEDLDLVCT